MAKAATKKVAVKPTSKKAVKAQKITKAKAKVEKEAKAAKPSMASFYAETIGEIDKELRLTIGEGTSAAPLSTSSLVIDYVNGGGVRPGFYNYSGDSASGKSTTSLLTLASAVNNKVPFIAYHDAEGSLNPEFTASVLKTFDLGRIFQEGPNGEHPLARYYQTNVIEDFASQMAKMTRAMSTKVWDDELGSWGYLLPKGLKSTTAMLKRFEDVGLKPDKKASDDKSWIIPTDYAGPEGIVIVDSWINMVPRIIDEDVDNTGGMAVFARAASKAFLMFVGRLRDKGVILSGVSQLRINPMIKYGDNRVEPGGGAMEFYPFVRNRMSSIGVPDNAVATKDKEAYQLGVEKSVQSSGAVDHYAYKKITNIKNKLGRPFYKGTIRVWVSDHQGEPRGICPVHDILEYCRLTGQLSGNKNKLQFKPAKSAAGLGALEGKTIPYEDFKTLVLGSHFGDKELTSRAMKALKLSKPIDVRKVLTKQVQTDRSIYRSRAKASKDSEEVSDD